MRMIMSMIMIYYKSKNVIKLIVILMMRISYDNVNAKSPRQRCRACQILNI